MRNATFPPVLLGLLIGIQALCAIFFVGDVIDDAASPIAAAFTKHQIFESVATFALIAGIVVEAIVLRALLRRNAEMAHGLQIARGALSTVIDGMFDDWGLTPSERDVALFAIKGLSNVEIAGLRSSSEGTIKAHLNAVFRKAGVSGRHQLVSLLVEDLMAEPLVQPEPA
jgi:DNA-binding CsgD family transcriptional regulator